MVYADIASTTETTDAELVRAVMDGNTDGLGLLFDRYRPRLYATAVSLLGYNGDAEDAVQDTFLAALGRLNQLREPAAIGGWLYTILKNQCLMKRRSRLLQAPADETERCFRELADEERIENCIEIRDLRDWVWAALQKLPENLRATVMLRYFGTCDSYEELSAILGVPVGTIRSRLSDAKTKLSNILLSSTRERDGKLEKQHAERRAFYAEAFRSLYRGRRDQFLSHYAEDLHLLWSTGSQSRGRSYLAAEMDTDLRTGVRIEPLRILASGNLTVLEGVIVNPPEDPTLCPPGCVLVMHGREAQVGRMHVHLAARPPRPEE